jgi:hypothetical protein
MGLQRLPRKNNPPPEEVLERNNSEDEDSGEELSEEESEPGTPPPGLATPPELRALREQNEQLERDLQSYNIDGVRASEIAENMKYQVERMEAEIKRLKEKFAKDAMTCAAASGIMMGSGTGLALVAAGGSRAMDYDHSSMARVGTNDNNETTQYTPIDEIAREIRRAEVEIEVATSMDRWTEREEEEERVEEPVGKKERSENSDQDSDPSPSPPNA